MKVWEEEWETYWDEEYGAAYVRTPNPDDTICFDDHARAQLVAAAPEMARVLLEIEWSGQPLPVVRGSEWRTCVSCGRQKPQHKTDCALDAALKKAGVR